MSSVPNIVDCAGASLCCRSEKYSSEASDRSLEVPNRSLLLHNDARQQRGQPRRGNNGVDECRAESVVKSRNQWRLKFEKWKEKRVRKRMAKESKVCSSGPYATPATAAASRMYSIVYNGRARPP